MIFGNSIIIINDDLELDVYQPCTTQFGYCKHLSVALWILCRCGSVRLVIISLTTSYKYKYNCILLMWDSTLYLLTKPFNILLCKINLCYNN